MSNPDAVFAPHSIDELAEGVRATPDGALLITSGTNSHNVSIAVADRQLVRLSTSALVGIVRLERADYYVTCRAGMKLAELYAELAQHGLFVPFLEISATGTVGGVVATGQIANGTEWYNISRWVLALSVVTADGALVKTGAITYKSVAGYDLPKLFCGSFGTLGVIAEVSLRLYPRGARPYGKDLLPVAQRIPRLAPLEGLKPAGDKAGEIARRIKTEFDPRGIFPAISGWNSR
ncbi:MAG: FAD-binding oxidoreductase [candidate division Zixibacteria bacterium]|nr:FAD-binding oxidoreductase [candidate division Zixibacteria bacterium]